MRFMIAWLRPFLHQDEGQDLLEYALLVALIALVAVGMVTASGQSVNDIFANISDELDTAAGAGGTP